MCQIKINMSEAWTFLQPVTGFKRKKHHNTHQVLLTFVYLLTILHEVASAEKRTVVELRKLEKTPLQKLTAGVHSSETVHATRLIGKLTGLGRENEANGRIHLLPTNCNDDEKGFARLPRDWVAVLHYTDRVGSSTDNGTSRECPSMLDRMRKAFMFGASAIIILTLNPNIIKELDVGQLFSKPVVLVDIAENVTTMLQIVSSKVKVKARFVYNVTVEIVDSHHNFFTTVSLWGKCGRYSGRSYHDWDGVVCMGHPDFKSDGKIDPENFWNYFYMGILILMMLHYIRKRRAEDWEDPDYIEGHLRQLAYQALSVMKIKRYSYDGGLDTCAICLEKFFHKQKLRVLPCGHHFHTKCVDPWLVHNHTCPLCKLNIIEKYEL